jgi:serine/threonine protein kinase
MSDDSQNLPADELIGKVLGQYTILEEAGRGGMATVYLAKQASMSRNVAIKVLPPHFLHDPSFLERFKREVEVISQLEHPHILPIYEFGEADGMPYIAMRYLGGGSMAQMIRRGVPDLDDLIRPLRQISQALDYAHLQGIIHRDLKPGNIMLDEGGNAYLSDFGIARVMGSDLTGSAIIGTPAYMSPEQANGIAIDGRSDIYSLGVVLFELITGREPYQAETPMALLLKHMNEPMPAARDFREGVPDSIEEVLAKSTAKDPDNRYSSTREMSDAFEHAIRTQGEIRVSASTQADSQKDTPASPRAVTDVNEGSDYKATVHAMADTPTMQQPKSTLTDSSPDVEEEINRRVQSALKESGQFQPEARKRSPMLMMFGLIVVVLAIVGGGVLLAPQILGDLDGDDNDLAMPTPFASAGTIEQETYTLSVPSVFNQSVDNSDINRTYHKWLPSDESAFVTVAMVADNAMTLASYENRYYDNNESLSFIDEATAEDGTIRKSYRVSGDERLPNGQLDTFYMQKGDTLAVIELFTSDASEPDNATISRFQLILDSFRVGTES